MFIAAVAPVIDKVAVVAPAYTPPFVTLLKVPPPSVLTCHWNEVAVAAVTENEAFAVAQIVWFAGCVVIDGPAPAVIVKTRSLDLTTEPAVPVTVIV